MNENTTLRSFRIRTVDFIYGENDTVKEVDIRFDSNESTGEYLNGNIKISFEDYTATTTMKELEELAKSKLKLKFSTSV